jgi:hypothetical protein
MLRTAEWHPRRVLITAMAGLNDRWRSLGWGRRSLAVAALFVLQLVPRRPDVLFGIEVSQAVIRAPQHVLLISALLGLGALQRDSVSLAVRRRWTRQPGRYPVRIGLWEEQRLLGLDEGIVWLENGVLRVEAMRFGCAFDAQNAREAGLAVETVRRASRSGPNRGWTLRLAPFSRNDYRPLRDAVAQWSEAGLDAKADLLPPREAQREEPWFLRLAPAIVEAGGFVAFYFLACVGMVTTSMTIFKLALGGALSLLATCVVLRVLAGRASRRAERAITESVEVSPVAGGRSEVAIPAEAADTAYHQA